MIAPFCAGGGIAIGDLGTGGTGADLHVAILTSQRCRAGCDRERQQAAPRKARDVVRRVYAVCGRRLDG